MPCRRDPDRRRARSRSPPGRLTTPAPEAKTLSKRAVPSNHFQGLPYDVQGPRSDRVTLAERIVGDPFSPQPAPETAQALANHPNASSERVSRPNQGRRLCGSAQTHARRVRHQALRRSGGLQPHVSQQRPRSSLRSAKRLAHIALRDAACLVRACRWVPDSSTSIGCWFSRSCSSLRCTAAAVGIAVNLISQRPPHYCTIARP